MLLEVLIKIEKVAICGSDIALYNWSEVAQVGTFSRHVRYAGGGFNPSPQKDYILFRLDKPLKKPKLYQANELNSSSLYYLHFSQKCSIMWNKSSIFVEENNTKKNP